MNTFCMTIKCKKNMKNNAQAIVEFKIEKGITTNNMPQEIIFYIPFLH